MEKNCPNCGPGSLIRLVEKIVVIDYTSDNAEAVYRGWFWYCSLCEAIGSPWVA